MSRHIAAQLLCGAAFLCGGTSAFAQEAPEAQAQSDAQSASGDAIVVTARRREETLISAPVVVSAVNARAIEARGIVNLDGIARIVPQLIIGPQAGSVQGGNISIRGIAGPDSNPFGDQAVSFDIDGIQVAKATVRRMTDFDMAQVEVYKGPQALFFGKNSMAGIVNMRSADPGDHFEMGMKIGYEPNAREMRAEGFVSTPLTENLGIRLAGQYSTMEGWLVDQTPRNSVYFDQARNPDTSSYGLRGTLTYDGGDSFDARFKINYAKVKGNGPAALNGFISCPFGARQFSFLPAGADNAQCGASQYNVNAGYGPNLTALGGTLNHFRSDGRNFLDQRQILTSLVLNFHPTDTLNISTATGYYDVDLDQCQNYENSYAVILPSCNQLRNKEFSQEVNINTDFDGPLNFTGGLYFGDTKATTSSLTFLFAGGFDLLFPGYGGPNSPAQVNNYQLTQEGRAYSGFISGSFKPVEQLEISGGVRYSYEKKRILNVRTGGGISEVFNPAIFKLVLDDSTLLRTTAQGGTLTKDRDSWDDFSPEATITYRPSTALTVFASYKHGFLSGGFNSSSVNFSTPNLDLSYRPQTIEGFEGGVKAMLLDGALLLNSAVYTYRVKDLQVVNFTNATSTIRNAAASKIDGIEADFTYRTPLDGLTLNGSAAYNKARYTSFPAAPCYNGQTPAQGCNAAGTQNLAGAPVARSPEWNLQAGMTYEREVGDSHKLGINANLMHSSSYLTDATAAPNGRQPAYTMIDAGIRFGARDDRWTLSVIGRNLTDKHVFYASTDVPFTGSGTGTATGVLGDRFASIGRGREVLVQIAYRFGQ